MCDPGGWVTQPSELIGTAAKMHWMLTGSVDEPEKRSEDCLAVAVWTQQD